MFYSPPLPSLRSSLIPLLFLPLEWYPHIWGCWNFSCLSGFQLVTHPAWHLVYYQFPYLLCPLFIACLPPLECRLHESRYLCLAHSYNPKAHNSIWYMCVCPKSLESCPILCDPMDHSPQALLSIGFSSKNIRVGCHALLQVVFPTQG